MKNILIVVNTKKYKSKELAYEIKEYLLNKNMNPIILITKTGNENFDYNDSLFLIISLGGDGTVLYASKFAYKFDCPILPINMGTFGYITGVNKVEWKNTLDLFLEYKLKLSNRMLVCYETVRNNEVIHTGIGLNDVVITTSGLNKIANMELRIQGTSAGIFKSDGLIVSTPTGSTGYALAGGGPIVEPSIEALIVVSICPFTLSNRPIVINSEHNIEIEVLKKTKEMMLTCDGQVATELYSGDVVRIYKSPKKISLVKSNTRTYYEVVRDKLSWGGSF